MKTKFVEYKSQDGAVLQGFLAYDEFARRKKGTILVAHGMNGRNAFVEEKAKKLAELGYTAFALDMYGNGRVESSRDDARKLMMEVLKDRKVLAGRVSAALDAVKDIQGVDPTKVSAIGYCFGGLCVLDLARSGADVCAVASFHGVLKPSGLEHRDFKAKVAIFQGDVDPACPFTDIAAIRDELNGGNAQWRLHLYGNVAHAFTEPEVDELNLPGLKYDKTADETSWQSMLDFVDEAMGR